MNYLELESKIETRKSLAEDIRRKMKDFEKSMDGVSKCLFDLSLNGHIPMLIFHQFVLSIRYFLLNYYK